MQKYVYQKVVLNLKRIYMMKKKGRDDEAHVVDEDVSTHTVQSPTESVTSLAFDDYQCTGDVQVDFPKLCALLDVKNIPSVHIIATEAARAVSAEGSERVSDQHLWSKPHLHVELKNKNRFSCKGLKIVGWKVDEQILQVLNKLVHNLSHLQSLNIWQARLTDEMVISLSNTVSLGCSLRVVYLEGNPLPQHSYHLLLSEDSVISDLYLRNNQIGDEGARLIGRALSTAQTANRTLLYLTLSFNHIGDAGAEYIAQGLRLNRTLSYLTLANNRIGDSGAAHLSKILGEFPLTHEEIVARRRLIVKKIRETSGPDLNPPGEELNETNSAAKPEPKGHAKKKATDTAKKEEKPEKGPTNNENPKKGALKQLKSPEKVKEGKAASNKIIAPVDPPEVKSSIVLDETEEKITSPLMDPRVRCQDGQVFYPGNSTLVYLSLAGNAITQKSLPLFLSSLEQQTEGGMLRLCLNRNRFSPNCETFNKINGLLQLRANKAALEESKGKEQE